MISSFSLAANSFYQLGVYSLLDCGLKFFRFIRSYAVDFSVSHDYFNRIKT